MTIIELIREYVSHVRYCASQMREHFGVQNLLAGWRDGRIPKRGEITDGGLSFSFHGIGCTVEMRDCSVDFDFGPNGDVGGFDAYRLAQFANSRQSMSNRAFREDEIRVELRRLQEKGFVVASGVEPSPNLLYLKQDDATMNAE